MKYIETFGIKKIDLEKIYVVLLIGSPFHIQNSIFSHGFFDQSHV
jgi:hypothetical protein